MKLERNLAKAVATDTVKKQQMIVLIHDELKFWADRPFTFHENVSPVRAEVMLLLQQAEDSLTADQERQLILCFLEHLSTLDKDKYANCLFKGSLELIFGSEGGLSALSGLHRHQLLTLENIQAIKSHREKEKLFEFVEACCLFDDVTQADFNAIVTHDNPSVALTEFRSKRLNQALENLGISVKEYSDAISRTAETKFEFTDIGIALTLCRLYRAGIDFKNYNLRYFKEMYESRERAFPFQIAIRALNKLDLLTLDNFASVLTLSSKLIVVSKSLNFLSWARPSKERAKKLVDRLFYSYPHEESICSMLNFINYAKCLTTEDVEAVILHPNPKAADMLLELLHNYHLLAPGCQSALVSPAPDIIYHRLVKQYGDHCGTQYCDQDEILAILKDPNPKADSDRSSIVTQMRLSGGSPLMHADRRPTVNIIGVMNREGGTIMNMSSTVVAKDPSNNSDANVTCIGVINYGVIGNMTQTHVTVDRDGTETRYSESTFYV